MDFGAPLCGAELEPFLERIDVEKKAIVSSLIPFYSHASTSTSPPPSPVTDRVGPAVISPFSQKVVNISAVRTPSFNRFVDKINSMRDGIEEFILFRIEAWHTDFPEPDDATPFEYIIRFGYIGSATWV